VSIDPTVEVITPHAGLCFSPDDGGHDAGISAFRAADGTVTLTNGMTIYNLRSIRPPGASSFARDCSGPTTPYFPNIDSTITAFPGYAKTGPAYNGGACGFWIMGHWAESNVLTKSTGTVHALVQTNYCPEGSGWYSNIAGAKSLDGGSTYRFVTGPDPAPGVIVSPYKYNASGGWRQGTYVSSNIVQNTYAPGADNFWYVFAGNPVYASSTPRTLSLYCLWQSKNISDPSAWRGWDGAAFSVKSVNPYTTNATSICKGVTNVGSSFSWSTALNAWLAVDVVDNWFSYSVGTNLTNWSFPTAIQYGAWASSEQANYNGFTYAYPALIDIDLPGNDANFGASGATPALYYLRINPDTTRDTVRQNLSISALLGPTKDDTLGAPPPLPPPMADIVFAPPATAGLSQAAIIGIVIGSIVAGEALFVCFFFATTRHGDAKKRGGSGR